MSWYSTRKNKPGNPRKYSDADFESIIARKKAGVSLKVIAADYDTSWQAIKTALRRYQMPEQEGACFTPKKLGPWPDHTDFSHDNLIVRA